MDAARRRTLIAGGAGVVVVAAAATVVAVWPGDDAAPKSRPTPKPTVVAAAPRTTSVAPTPTPTPTKTEPPRERVAAAHPTAFRISGPAFTIKAKVCSMPPVVPLDPPGDQHNTVCWVNGRWGMAPGSETGTTFVLGHAWGQDPQEVLNPLSARATKQIIGGKAKMVDGAHVYPVTNLTGYLLTLRTGKGVLTYAVRSAYGVPKQELPRLRDMWKSETKGRIVLITCAQRGGRDYDYNVVTEAYLTSSTATRA